MSKKELPVVICPYCGNPAELSPGNEIYFGRKETEDRWFWECVPCGAHVGAHANSPSHKPMGGLAKPELRTARAEAHRVFDPLWLETSMSRTAAYRWLADELGIGRHNCHIGYFNLEWCERTISMERKIRAMIRRRRKEAKQPRNEGTTK